MAIDPQLPDFDAGNWFNVAKCALAASVVLAAAMTAVLLIFDPPAQCPDWRFGKTHATSLWEMLALWTMPVLVFNCFIVLRWNWFARKAAETARPMAAPVTYIMTRMCLLGAVAAQVPLFFLITECTDWLRA
jgi:hypothetical protein